ncbi:MAG: hypothetical protein KJ955_08040 [Nanoarchaeota archaeon]|nr:hypothetical protein [Nanoarchaeota archaeon]
MTGDIAKEILLKAACEEVQVPEKCLEGCGLKQSEMPARVDKGEALIGRR